jgi:hypothetical protein
MRAASRVTRTPTATVAHAEAALALPPESAVTALATLVTPIRIVTWPMVVAAAPALPRAPALAPPVTCVTRIASATAARAEAVQAPARAYARLVLAQPTRSAARPARARAVSVLRVSAQQIRSAVPPVVSARTPNAVRR